MRNETVTDGNGTTHGHVVGYVLVNSGWRQAFDVLSEHDKQPEYSSCLAAVQILSQAQEGELRRVKLRETHKYLWMKMRYTLDYVHDPVAREIRFTLDPSAENDVSQYSGKWALVPIGDKTTLVIYQVSGASSGGLLRGIMDYFTRSELGDFLSNNIKKRIESGGTWTKS